MNQPASIFENLRSVMPDEMALLSGPPPDPLTFDDGSEVSVAEAWPQRRDEIRRHFETQVYGKLPGAPPTLRFETRSADTPVFDDRAIRRQITVHFTDEAQGPSMDLLIYLPAKTSDPAPLFLGLNFRGNQAIHPDPGITLPSTWMRDRGEQSVKNNRATEASRGLASRRWPVEELIKRGFGLATVYCGDLDPDYDDGFQNGVHPLFYRDGQSRPAADEGATISAWAWGLCRAMDYLSAAPEVDSQRVGVIGHSRLGKTALWAGAMDERFAMVVSSGSGCGGAAMSRHQAGESVSAINHAFPHWFCENFKQYNDQPEQLPVDQHMLLALIAPRTVLICDGQDDHWADPVGEFLSSRLASPVYRLLGQRGIEQFEMPELHHRIGEGVSYHMRPGKHNLTLYEWTTAMAIAEQRGW